jgi:hypothetical protein
MRFGMRLTILLALFMTACSSVAPELSSPSEMAVVIQLPTETATLQPTAEPEPSPTVPKPDIGTASFRGVRFQYDLSFLSAVRGEIVPAVQGDEPELDIPEHLSFTFDDVVRSSQFNPHEPQLLVFPIDDFRAISSKRAETTLESLTELLVERPLPFMQEVTLMPPPAGKPSVQVHVKYLRFENGEGVRFLTSYSEEIGPVTNETLFYTFQGISSDREYYVSFFFPVDTRQVPDLYAETLAAEDYWLFVSRYDTYLGDTIDLLEKTPSSGFSPDLRLLDKLIESLHLPDAGTRLQQVSDPDVLTDRIRREGKTGLRALWRDLNISSVLFEAPGQLNLELFDVKVNGNRDEYRLLLISDSLQLDWQYLLFRSTGNRWLFVGNVDVPDQKFLPPACRIVERNGQAWWVLNWLEDSEPGNTRYSETWYRFSEDVLRPVLNFPLEGYQISNDLAYNVMYRGDLVAEEDEVNGSGSPLRSPIPSYSDSESRSNISETYNLFDINRSVLYVWDDQEHTFTLEPEFSQLTQDQIDAAFYYPGPEPTFLQFAEAELSSIAINGTPLQKRWLLQFLEILDQPSSRRI